MGERDDAAHLANIHGTLLAIMHELEEMPDNVFGDLAGARYFLLCAVKRIEARDEREEAQGDG